MDEKQCVSGEESLAQQHSLGIVAHEIKSPIAAVIQLLQAAELLLREPGQEDARALVQRAIKRAKSALDLTRNLLDYIQIDQTKPSINQSTLIPNDNIVKILETHSQTAASRDIQLVSDICDGDTPIAVGQFEWEIIVNNLISNAIRYSKRKQGSQRVWIRTFRDHDAFVLEVQDEGIGLAGDEQSKVFDGFYRAMKAKEQTTSGSGFGLSMVKKIVDEMGGSIECQSKSGIGTTFTVRFPLVKR